MNRTFKVVFNRARACLVVANEITRTVQKKGTKIILVASAVAVASMPALAASLVNKTWNSEWTETSEITWEVDATTAGSNTDVRGIDIQSGATGSVSNLNLKVDAQKSETTTPTAIVYGVYSAADGGTAPSFSGDKFSVEVSSNFNAHVYGLNVTKGLSITAKEVSITTQFAKGYQKYAYGLYADKGSQVTLGSADSNTTTSVTVSGGDFYLVGLQVTEGKMTVAGESLTINVNLTDNCWAVGLLVQHNKSKKPSEMDEEYQANRAKLVIDAENTSIKVSSAKTLAQDKSAGSSGIVAMSNGVVEINGNLEVEAENVILSRGYSDITINKDSNKTVKLVGNVDFNYNRATSNTTVDTTVTVTLSNEDSYWQGRSYASSDSANTSEGIPAGEVALPNEGNLFNVGANSTGFTLTVKDGAHWYATGDSFVNTLNLSGNGIVDAKTNWGASQASTKKININTFNVSGTGNELVLADDMTLAATITMSDGAVLSMPLSTAFTVTETDDVVTAASSRFTVALATDATQATLAIPTSFTVKADVLTAMNKAYEAVTLNLENVTVKFDSEASDTDKTTTVHTDIITKSITGQGDLAIKSGKTLTISGENESSDIGTIELGVVESSETGSSTLEIKNQTNVSVSEIKGNGVILVAENSSAAVETLSGSSKVSVGEVNGQGATLSVKSLEMTGGSIFVDPYYGHSTFSVGSLDSGTLNTNITAGSGGLVIIGSATESEVNTAIANIEELSAASAVVYTNKAITIGSSGSIVIDPTLEAAETGNTQKIVVRNGGTLVIDQAALNGAAVFSGATSVVVAGEANFGVVNAAIGQIPLVTDTSDETDAVTVGTDAQISVYTDSPFLTATLANDTGIITIAGSSDSEGQAVISSLGIQSMIRRADMILAETIADRAAEMELGSNLWVMVRGERYEQDGLDDGAGFHANMGYGAFGAEFAPNEKTNIGLAFQYGHGTVKGDVGSAKNKTKDYSATLYGSALIGDTGIKLLGEVAYTQSSNDITNSYYTGLNQDLDAKMISGGVTLLKRFDFDSFSLTPSIGARVSKIKTDAMKMGLNKLDKQSQTIVQVPIALRLAGKTAQTENGWSVTPRFKVAYIPTFGDKEIDIYGVEKTVLDTSPVQGAFGINFQKGGFSIDATANAGVGNRGTSAIGGKLEMNYRF